MTHLTHLAYQRDTAHPLGFGESEVYIYQSIDQHLLILPFGTTQRWPIKWSENHLTRTINIVKLHKRYIKDRNEMSQRCQELKAILNKWVLSLDLSEIVHTSEGEGGACSTVWAQQKTEKVRSPHRLFPDLGTSNKSWLDEPCFASEDLKSLINKAGRGSPESHSPTKSDRTKTCVTSIQHIPVNLPRKAT